MRNNLILMNIPWILMVGTFYSALRPEVQSYAASTQSRSRASGCGKLTWTTSIR